MPEMTGMRRSYPPTYVVMHPKENRRKCSLWPLRGRPDLVFVRFRPDLALDLPGYVRLSVHGPPLSPDDGPSGLLLIDGTWRYAEQMEQHFAHVPPRSLHGIRTAYPRRSKLFEDPPEGLASVEALFAAYRILGRPTEGLLDHYRWAAEFLAANNWTEDSGRCQSR